MADWYDDDSDQDQGNQNAGNNPLRDIRNQLKEERKARKEAEAQLKELTPLVEEFRSRQKVEAVSSVFKEIGLTEKHAKLYAKLNPEGEADEASVIEWAKEYDLIEEIDSDESDPASKPERSGFAPTPTSGQPVGGKLLSREEWRELQRQNPAEAMAAYREGRVDTKHLLPEDGGRVQGELPRTAEDFRRQNRQAQDA